jgi:hypothetical protein
MSCCRQDVSTVQFDLIAQSPDFRRLYRGVSYRPSGALPGAVLYRSFLGSFLPWV